MIDVWVWNNSNLSFDASQLRSTLSVSEIARSEKLFDRGQAAMWVAARARIRTLLGQFIGLNAPEIRFESTRLGKLSLGNDIPTQIEFSISHAWPYSALAITSSSAIGIDIEAIRSLTLDEMNWPLSDQERQDFARVSSDQRASAFFRYWTLKEAFIKGLGSGFSYSPHDFDMSAPDQPPALLRAEGYPEAVNSWRFSTRQLAPNLQISIAADSAGRPLSITHHADQDRS